MIMLTIRDSVAEVYARPFFARSAGEGIRSFSDLLSEPDHPIGQHPDHYTLFEIGSFDEQTGMIVAHEPRSLGNGMDYESAVTLEA